MKIDFHLHTCASFDCESDPVEIIKWAAKKGLHCLAVTDHDNTDGYESLRAAADRQGIFVIPGVEFTVKRGTHFLVYLKPEMPLPQDDLEMIAEIHRRGGLVGIPHPYRSDTGLIFNHIEKNLYDIDEVDRILSEVDFIEVFNAKSSSEQNQKALELAKKYPHLKPIAGSDSHHPASIGAAHTEVHGFKYSTIEGMAKMLRNLQVKVVVLSELDESMSSRSVRRAVEGIRRLMVKIKPAVPTAIWRMGKSIYRGSSNRLAEKRASKSITNK